MIIISGTGINSIVIPNNHTTGDTYSISITNDVSLREISFDISATTATTRYIEFNLDIVDELGEESLPDKIYIEKGMNVITVDNDYTNILFREFETTNYSYNKEKEDVSTDNVFVYKR